MKVKDPLMESLPSAFNLRMDDRLANLRLDLAAEMSEELRKLRLHISKRFQNIERRIYHQSSSDFGLDMRITQKHLEKCLRRETELNRTSIQDQMLSQMPNKSSREGILTHFERKGKKSKLK